MAGIGLGHQLGREHDSTPQSGVEASSLVKTENLQIENFLCQVRRLVKIVSKFPREPPRGCN